MKTANKPIAIAAFAIVSLGLFFAQAAQAVCPVCTVAVGACVGLSRYLGIDDSITGIWIGGLIISTLIWTISYFEKRNIHFIGHKVILAVFYYAAVIVPLYYEGIIGHPFNKIWLVDKLVAGMAAGSVFFLLSVFINAWLKRRHGGQVYFPFQKVVIPLAILGLLSAVFYFLTC